MVKFIFISILSLILASCVGKNSSVYVRSTGGEAVLGTVMEWGNGFYIIKLCDGRLVSSNGYYIVETTDRCPK